ncbi:hypothetical protein, partial [Phocaeicola plebeius]|uniref:hypothetical protein n=1 Tax=Phocaeicola plebeius TaxID=310297 RepID=UPI0026F1D452
PQDALPVEGLQFYVNNSYCNRDLIIKLTPTSRVKTFVCNFTAVCAKWTRSAKRWCQKEVAVLYNFFLCYVAICHNDGVTLWIKS